MKRFHARVEVVKALKELGLYVDTKDNKMQIPVCRCVDEPTLFTAAHQVLCYSVNPVISSNPCSSHNGGSIASPSQRRRSR